MTSQPKVLAPEASIDDAMAMIADKRVRHLPLVEEGRVIGLISIGDLNKWVVENLKFEAESLRNYVAGSYPG